LEKRKKKIIFFSIFLDIILRFEVKQQK